MFKRKSRRFRRRVNGSDHLSLRNGHMQTRLGSNSFSNDHTRNNFRTTLSAEKLLEKYNTLAKEALSSGDRTSSENYLQHADHFMRIIEEKNKNRDQTKVNTFNKPKVDDTHPSEDSDMKQLDPTKNKE